MSSKRKLITLTYADKLKAIEAVKNGLKRKEVAAQFGIHEKKCTIRPPNSCIWAGGLSVRRQTVSGKRERRAPCPKRARDGS
ncbi:hypothetical protein K1T71_005771 [Dendrolimus kikuchii]|uniref:Uncharacterized protein n=1 Tax=Dendrolimus kikuchii TaxID=765133 RepID=A0ACC1D4V2_9NEOP|nr:hypothetical protein K1T71_005771 [Dendrolimus kikuchii]